MDTTSMLTAQPQPQADDRLTTLPSELVLDILGYLAARDLVALRATDRCFRQFLATETSRLARGPQHSFRTHLNKDSARYSLANLPSHQALRHFCSFSHHRASRDAMSTLFYALDFGRWYRSHNNPTSPPHTINDLRNLSTWMLNYSQLYHGQPTPSPLEDGDTVEGLLVYLLASRATILPSITAEEIAAMIASVQQQPLASHCPAGRQTPITEDIHEWADGPLARDTRLLPAAMVDRLVLPRLPVPERIVEKPEYVYRSQRAVKLLQGVEQQTTAELEDYALMVAALMEDIEIMWVSRGYA